MFQTPNLLIKITYMYWCSEYLRKMLQIIRFDLWKIFAFSFYIFHFISVVHTKDCIKQDQCSCTFDDGSGTMDLSNLGSQSGDPL